jgi:hypothetical protein
MHSPFPRREGDEGVRLLAASVPTNLSRTQPTHFAAQRLAVSCQLGVSARENISS